MRATTWRRWALILCAGAAVPAAVLVIVTGPVFLGEDPAPDGLPQYLVMGSPRSPRIPGPPPPKFHSASTPVDEDGVPWSVPGGGIGGVLSVPPSQAVAAGPERAAFQVAADRPLSTFALDVDTASYTIARRALREGRLPDPATVRIEEFVNALDAGDPPVPAGQDVAVLAEGGPGPAWEDARIRLVRFNVRARSVPDEARAPATLTVLLDVSGSMGDDGKLLLAKTALAGMAERLRPDDRVALVVFSSSARVVLQHTGDAAAFARALEPLVPEQATGLEGGLALAYEVASVGQRGGTLNRVVLCSDGVANVGLTDAHAILDQVAADARRGIELSVFGFGMGEYNDPLMEQLADRGDGRYAYVDRPAEARRVLVEQLTGTLQTIAVDARAQVAFDPAAVVRYRLVGYENRFLPDDRFRDDTADAGEVGSGQSVTVLYEVELADAEPDPGARIAVFTLRYRPAQAAGFQEIEQEIRAGELAAAWDVASPALHLCALLAEFAERLRSEATTTTDGRYLLERAQRTAAEFPGRVDVAEFVDLIQTATTLMAAPETSARAR